MDALTTLRSLPAEYRDVLVLREFQRRSYDQIAQRLGIPRNLVAGRLTTARRELMKQLDMVDNTLEAALPWDVGSDSEART
jgi:RNA polymerase sigma factor (sigma-70 family)